MITVSRLRSCPHPVSPVIGLAALWVLSCGGSGGLPADTLPAGWAGAQALTVQQSTCNGDALTSPKQPRLDLTESGGTLTGVYKDAEFRCGEQQACAYLRDAGPTAR